MGESHMGQHARLMSQALRKLTGIMNKTGCTVIFINQLREKIGVMFGNPETTTGGRALKFYASVRMDVRRVETLKTGGEMVGNRARVKVVKNKMHHHLRKLNLILCLVRVYQEKEIFLTWQLIVVLLLRVVHGMHIIMRRLVRDVRMQEVLYGESCSNGRS